MALTISSRCWKKTSTRYNIRVMLARYRGKNNLSEMSRYTFETEAGYVRVGGKNISELVDLPITELKEFFDHLNLNEHDSNVARTNPD